MVLYLKEKDVKEVLTVKDAIYCVEKAFLEMAQESGKNRPRTRIRIQNTTLHIMPAGLESTNVVGFKAYTSSKDETRFLINIYNTENGRLLSIMQADYIGQMRTGAASAVATKYMARKDSNTIGIIGTGRQARTQLMAICDVMNIKKIKAFSRRKERRDDFCREMEKLLGIEVISADSPQTAVFNSDIIVTATRAKEPLFNGELLREGMHINAIGSNYSVKREIDEVSVKRSKIIVVDFKKQAMVESGDLIKPVEMGIISWDSVYELKDVVSGKVKGRSSNRDITLFESQGIAIEDIAVAFRVYELAKEKGLGEELPI